METTQISKSPFPEVQGPVQDEVRPEWRVGTGSYASRFSSWIRAHGAWTKATFLGLCCVAVGFWFNVFDDAVSGVDVATSMPASIFAILYFGGGLGCLVLLTVIASNLFKVRTRVLPLAAVGVLLSFFLTMVLFELTPLRGTIGYTDGTETQIGLAVERFGMRLFLCWGATIFVATATGCLRRDSPNWAWLTGSLGLGLVASLLCGASLLGRYAPWLTQMKWSKFLSTGIMVLLFVLLSGILAEAMQSRGSRAKGKRA